MSLKYLSNKIIFIIFIGSIVVFESNYSCLENKYLQEEKSMENYSKIFADYRSTSFQDQKVRALGKLNWFVPSDIDDFPRMVLTNDREILVKYNSKYQLFDGNNVKSTNNCDFGYNIVMNPKSILYTDQMVIKIFDINKDDVTGNFEIPDINAESIIKVIYQFNDKCFVEILNRAKEESELVFPKTDESKSADFTGDKTIMSVINSNQQTIWRKEFEDENINSLIVEELGQVIIFYNKDPYSNTFSIFDLNTGNEINSTTIEKASLLNASLDFSNNINAILHFDNNEIMLRNYSMDGNINWEYILPISTVDYINQPPAINKINQVFCLINNKIFAVDKGKLLWEFIILEDEYFKFFTITGENNLLIISSYLLNYIDSDGQLIFNYIIDQNERITTPPIIDEKGLIYFGSTKGIYSLK